MFNNTQQLESKDMVGMFLKLTGEVDLARVHLAESVNK